MKKQMRKSNFSGRRQAVMVKLLRGHELTMKKILFFLATENTRHKTWIPACAGMTMKAGIARPTDLNEPRPSASGYVSAVQKIILSRKKLSNVNGTADASIRPTILPSSFRSGPHNRTNPQSRRLLRAKCHPLARHPATHQKRSANPQRPRHRDSQNPPIAASAKPTSECSSPSQIFQIFSVPLVSSSTKSQPVLMKVDCICI